MFHLVLDGTARIDVTYRDKTISYATDGSLPNPLEATYAALAGCAGVYTIKACKALGIPDEGIGISVKPVVRPANPSMPARIETIVAFPGRIGPEQREAILASIDKCAVKELMKNGGNVEFNVKDGDPGRATADR